ncbi:bifunctional riboflavin kinase/FAD synthetase [Puteibacter caeruleilacunae]|nr:bifunctional riboflavin kinase/FAD synthetase [Puteibacter caeruleilacunae]
MKIYHSIENFKAKNPVVTIGTFDGVHRGHQQVIKELIRIAKENNGESVVFTFYPHPRLVVNPDDNSLRLLNTLEEKKKLFAKIGLDHLVVFPFTKEFSKMDYSDFVKNILVGQMNMAHLVVGYDHKFGHKRKGGFDFLEQCAQKLGFGISKLEVLESDATNISSTKVREALLEGNLVRANKFLGYQYALDGHVVKGNQIGRTLDFPTANIEVFDVHKLIPAEGVYVVRVSVGDRNEYQGMLNIGTRPTIQSNEDHKSIEVNIFDLNEDIYEEPITVLFETRIRSEKKFNSLDALKDQLYKDREYALNYFKIRE